MYGTDAQLAYMLAKLYVKKKNWQKTKTEIDCGTIDCYSTYLR